MEKIKGVNLGNWLVLEKWMHPDLFFGDMGLEDEYDLTHLLPPEEAALRLKLHRDSYVTERDFSLIASRGINTVRLPVPFSVFGDCPPYVGCIEYVDKALDWAEKYGLKVLIDVHTAPDSQNGFDNGGISGVCKWHLKKENVDFSVALLGRLAERYASHPALFGMQPLNEPASDMVFSMIGGRYKPRDPEYAKGSCGVPDDILKDFYRRAYAVIRKYIKDKPVVFHDGFRDAGWEEFFTDGTFENVILDTHFYLTFAAGAMGDRPKTVEGIREMMNGMFERLISKYEGKIPVVVGEWCISCPIDGLADMDEEQKKKVYQTITDMQLDKFSSLAGYFYWSYKLIADNPGWDMEKCIERGWFKVR